MGVDIVDNKNQQPTGGIDNKGFSSMQSVVVRFNFSCFLDWNYPEIITGHTAHSSNTKKDKK